MCIRDRYSPTQADLSIYAASAERKQEHRKNMKKGLEDVYKRQVREDIVMAMEQPELTDAQAQALLDSPTPLADVYRYFEKLETGYMVCLLYTSRCV